MNALAPIPPMGWNSWDCFGGSVTEGEVRANAAFMASRLAHHGWDTVVVDIQWYESAPGNHTYNPETRAVLDAYGRQLPDPSRFPSAADGRGFAALARQIRLMGLKFGVHLMRGISRRAVHERLPLLGTDLTLDEVADTTDVCQWNQDMYGVKPEYADAWYDSVARLLATWRVDYVKFDDVLYPPIRQADIAALHGALGRSGHPIVLSLSPGRRLSLANLPFLRENAELWRTSDDLWDHWPQVVEQFQRAARWAPGQRAGAWGDLDMLPLGRVGIRAHVGEPRMSNLTLDEQRTMMTLWPFARSPLMFGGHLPESPADTLKLLTNDAVLDIGRYGAGNRELIRDGNLVVWAATVRGGEAPHRQVRDREVRGVFWLGDEPHLEELHLADLGVPDAGSAVELWSGADVPISGGSLSVRLPAHGVAALAFPH